jgi:hypothetical protein
MDFRFIYKLASPSATANYSILGVQCRVLLRTGWDVSPRETVYSTSLHGFHATRIDTGIYRIDFPSEWEYNIFGLQIIVNGIGYAMVETRKGDSFAKLRYWRKVPNISK